MSNLEVFKKIRDEWDRFFDMPDNSDYHFNRIKELMKQKKDFDVSLYRDRYIRGRIYHRVRNLNLPSMKEYYQYLNDNPKEMNHLKSLLTVHTTSFRTFIHFNT